VATAKQEGNINVTNKKERRGGIHGGMKKKQASVKFPEPANQTDKRKDMEAEANKREKESRRRLRGMDASSSSQLCIRNAPWD
jgi:hypothetical protein